MTLLTHEEIHAELLKAIQDAGGANAFANTHNIAPGLISEVTRGKRVITPQVATALGFKQVVRFVPR